MVKDFYSSQEYRTKQSLLTKKNWQRGVFHFLLKREKRICRREKCGKVFEVSISDLKVYCSRSCSASVNNKKRIVPRSVRMKISSSKMGLRSPFKGVIKVPRIETKCQSPLCRKVFLSEPWKDRKFCSTQCAMVTIGGQPTSPKAARAKAGIRMDIDTTTYFYSRWEANLARIFNHFRIKWVHQPATFDLRGQKYTPDFYLPEYNLYIEVKNFLGPYSKERDEKFRKFYPHIHLKLLLKEEYLKLERNYSGFLSKWEYKNSKFIVVPRHVD